MAKAKNQDTVDDLKKHLESLSKDKAIEGYTVQGSGGSTKLHLSVNLPKDGGPFKVS